MRPFVREFLQKTSPLYEIIIFTASASNYATAIVNHLDPERKYINTILTRENCMETKNGFFIKDLRIIKNRDLKDIVILDNLVHSFGFQINNGIPILEYLDDSHDYELKYMSDYLLTAAQIDDIREYNKEQLKLRDLLKFKMEELLNF
jgi:CTD small phosphatase-like protein 2